MIDLKKAVNEAVNFLPIPPEEDICLCSCYEQLIGAAYSLLTADIYGIQTRDTKGYHYAVRVKLSQLLLNATDLPFRPTGGPCATWASGFYFNTALQRIVWTGERLLKIFASLRITCCNDALTRKNYNLKGIGPIKGSVDKRLRHLTAKHNRGNQLIALQTLYDLTAINRVDLDKDDVTDANYFGAIREDVNMRKHSLGAFNRSSTLSTKWSGLKERQVMYAVKAFCVVCRVYAELDQYCFREKLLELPVPVK